MNDVERNALSIECYQKPVQKGQISIGCVGDSITAGVHSSGPTMTYPAQLQALLSDQYVVTNMGACGSTNNPHIHTYL